MKKSKHVLVLIILILPMFVLAPSLVASPNISDEVLTNQAPVESNLLAQFAEETLRVAVYAEGNTTLPLYATGGVYTDNYQNVINFLESEGYAVTAMSTQDILDRKLISANFDVFVLPDQLPKDEIVNLVKDYWLAGGGILSFNSAIGYLIYSGILSADYEGQFRLYPPASPGFWAYYQQSNSTVMFRNPVTKAFEVDDIVTDIAGNLSVFNNLLLPGVVGSHFTTLLANSTESNYGLVFSVDNPDRGGRIVQIPGDCSVIPNSVKQLTKDAISWLAPRPKARIAIDMTHVPYYGVDSWDINCTNKPRYNVLRNFLVNHSFTFDKLYQNDAVLTASDIAPFDVLLIDVQNINYTTAEIATLKNWVQNGGSLLILEDWVVATGQQNLNLLMADWGLSLNLTAATMGTFTTSEFESHPVIEEVSTLSITGGRWVNVTGSAYPIVTSGSNIVIGGAEIGNGRVILAGDVNFLDYTHIQDGSNVRFAINVFNWLSASNAKVLVYADYFTAAHPNFIPLKGPVAKALNDLDIPFFLTQTGYYFNMSLHSQDWDMVIFDNNQYNIRDYQYDLIDFAMGGGKVIFSTWTLNATVGDYFGVSVFNSIGPIPPVMITSPTHPIFNKPVDYGADNLTSTLNVGFGTNALNLTVYANATKLAGYSGYTGGAITINAGGNVIFNGPLLTMYNDDTDDSTYPDNVEIWENEIAYLYFNRPTIDHPADVTYMETETGNEITWLPTADAGPWSYTVRENGSVIESGRWYGGPISINVDGINASLTEYQLTVFDRLGYSVSDLVVLNVTEYIATTTPGGGGAPLDPTLLLIIGVAGVVIVIIVIILMKKKK